MINKEILRISKTLKLLYIEDNALARESTLELLNNYFIDITIAIDGKDGLNKFKENNFDLILSDIKIPHISGLKMIRKIRSINNNVFIVLLSAYNESSYILEGISLGIDGYILKPLILEKFLVVLSQICDKVSSKRESDSYKANLEQELKLSTQVLYNKLHHDELTGLYNRYSFFEDLKNKEIGIPIIFIVDINKFKTINEIYGLETGSIVLKQFASLLKELTLHTTCKVYRMSADEFVIRDDVKAIDSDKYEKDISILFNRIKDFVVEVDNDSISIEVTVGISRDIENAYECAQVALGYAKENRKVYEIYSSAIDKRGDAQDAMKWKEKTKTAINENLIVPVYQPIVNSEGVVIKHETLMRLKDKEKDELIPPSYFLDIAIKTGLYNELSSSIIFESLRLLEISSHTLSFNFAYEDIKNKNFLHDLESLFQMLPDLGKRAIFEITESENIADYSLVKKFIYRFRAYGIRIAIDDFGSGFSNFEYILEIEPDYLKIDGSLVQNIDTDNKAYILVKAIVQFSHELGIKVIAEYVHSQIIFDMLKKLDVDEYQGFYFSEPLEII